jgi:predicted RNA methylase
MWDVSQYERFLSERARAFFDLVAQIPAADPGVVVDLGCGTGELTAALLDRWPEARILDVDSCPAHLIEVNRWQRSRLGRSLALPAEFTRYMDGIRSKLCRSAGATEAARTQSRREV